MTKGIDANTTLVEISGAKVRFDSRKTAEVEASRDIVTNLKPKKQKPRVEG